NKWMQFKSVGQIAEAEGKRVIDAFLDLVVEEKLETRFLQAENNIDDEALSKILTHPNAVIGLGDGGAHVQFHGGYGYITKLLDEKKHTGALPGRVLRNSYWHANRA